MSILLPPIPAFNWADDVELYTSTPVTPTILPEPQMVVAKSWAEGICLGAKPSTVSPLKKVIQEQLDISPPKNEEYSLDVNGKSYKYLQTFGEKKHVASFYDQFGQPYFKVTVSTLPTENILEIGFTAGNGSTWNQPLAFKTLGNFADWLKQHNYREKETDNAEGVPSNPIDLFTQIGGMNALVYNDVYRIFGTIFRRITLIHCSANEGIKGFYGSKPRSTGKYFPKSAKGVGQTRKLFTLP
jgi:hypothetical protein